MRRELPSSGRLRLLRLSAPDPYRDLCSLCSAGSQPETSKDQDEDQEQGLEATRGLYLLAVGASASPAAAPRGVTGTPVSSQSAQAAGDGGLPGFPPLAACPCATPNTQHPTPNIQVRRLLSGRWMLVVGRCPPPVACARFASLLPIFILISARCAQGETSRNRVRIGMKIESRDWGDERALPPCCGRERRSRMPLGGIWRAPPLPWRLAA